MHKNAWAQVREILPRVVRRLAWEHNGWHPSTPEIQGYHLPRVFRTDTPRDRIHYDYAGSGSRTPERRVEGSDYGRGAPRQSPRVAPRGSTQRHARDGPRGRYARPDHNRRP